MPKKTTEQFIAEAEEIHNVDGVPLYLYDKTDYKTNAEKVIIYCKKHQKDFLQTPNMHLSKKRGCPDCGMEIKNQQGEPLRSNTQDFIEKAIKIHFDENGPLFNYDEVNYVNAKTHVIIKCRQNHTFLMAPTNHLQGAACTNCHLQNRKAKKN